MYLHELLPLFRNLVLRIFVYDLNLDEFVDEVVACARRNVVIGARWDKINEQEAIVLEVC